MANFDPKDYVTVNVRVEKFYKDFPNGKIHTKILRLDDTRVIVEAKVWKHRAIELPNLSDHGLDILTAPDGIGQAEEIRGEGFVNKTSALENGETSAIGRALAHMGYEVSKSLSSQEAAQSAKEKQDILTGPANPQQTQRIYTMLNRLGVKPSEHEIQTGLKIEALNFTQAGELISQLKGQIEREIAEGTSGTKDA